MPFFVCVLQLITVLLLINDFFELKHKVRLSKSVCGIFHFNSVSLLLSFIFLFNKTQFKDQNTDFSFGSIFFQVKIKMNNFFGWVYEIRPRMKIYESSYEIIMLI